MSFELRTYSSWGGIFDSISMSRSSLDSKTSRHSIHSTYSASSSRETTWTRGCRHGWSMDWLGWKFGALSPGWLRFMTFALTARALVQFPGILDRNQQLSSFSSTRNVKSRLGTHPLSSLRRVCRNWCRRSAARSFFPLYPALARRAQTKVAAARLFCWALDHLRNARMVATQSPTGLGPICQFTQR